MPDEGLTALLDDLSPSASTIDELDRVAVAEDMVRPAASMRGAQAEVPVGLSLTPSRASTFSTEAEQVQVFMPRRETLEEGRVLDGRRIAFRSSKSAEIFTVESVGGALRFHHIIGAPEANHEARYEIKIPAGSTPEQYPESIAIRDSAGRLLVAVAPPWAKDAEGQNVPTTLSYADGILTQRVNTQGLEVVYPLVAIGS